MGFGIGECIPMKSRLLSSDIFAAVNLFKECYILKFIMVKIFQVTSNLIIYFNIN